jgi:arylsulfatase A-like enzyme/predicted Zn-dependent protease
MPSKRTLAVASSVIVAVLAGWAWWRSLPPRTDGEARGRLARRSPAPRDLNVVVLTLDTLRADRLGCYGFDKVATPNLDGLAREGVLFEEVAATVPLTFPSHSSMFTGLLPPRHGVRDNGGFFLDASRTTLAERLQEAGYATGAFVGAWVLESKWGLAQGFDHYADHFDLSRYKTISLGTVQKPGDEVMDGALKWLETVRGRRFFAWVHLYDPHTPYDPPEPYRSRYPGQPYLGEVAYTDAVVGRLLSWLRDGGLLDRTLVVATADHGESLGEHGESTHAYFVYDSSMSVPFIVRTPWGDRGRVRAQVSGVDLMPTVLDLLGLGAPEGIDGRSLARLILDPAADAARPAYVETYFPRYHFGWQHLRGLRDGRYKYIDAPEPELYDVDADPGETKNIYKAFSRRAEDMRLAMEQMAGAPKGETPERQKLDPETLQRLAALGYVGNVTDADPDAVLPDPKSKAHLFELMSAAKDEAKADRMEEAIAKMRRVVAEDAGIVDAHLTLGNWLSRARRPDEAIAAFKQVLSLKPDNDLAMMNLAHIYRARRQTEAAVAGYRGVLEIDPRNAQAWFHLATLFLDEGDVGQAEATFREALKANPDMGAAYNSLGAIAYARGQADEAERLIRKGLELEPEVRTGRFNLGRIQEARGDLEQAEALYRDELRQYPDHGKARFNLAQLLRGRGDRPGFLAELQALVDTAPDFGPGYFFLAREELNAGRLESAAGLARRGLQVDAVSDVAPLGYYVLADVYNRQGQPARAQEEVAKARRLEAARRRHPLPRL